MVVFYLEVSVHPGLPVLVGGNALVVARGLVGHSSYDEVAALGLAERGREVLVVDLDLGVVEVPLDGGGWVALGRAAEVDLKRN